jgi:lactoylglutathione lyase
MLTKEALMQLGFTIVFVPDVEAAVSFYERAFGIERRLVTPAFAMMQTGQTTLAFGSEANERRELLEFAGLDADAAFRSHAPSEAPAAVQLSFIAEDVAAAYARAIEAGATKVYEPVQMPWGQWVGRVRDLHGVLVSIVSPPRS